MEFPVFLYIDMPVPEGLMRDVLAAGKYGDVRIQKSTLRETLQRNLPQGWDMQAVEPGMLPVALAALRGQRVVVWPAQVAVLNMASFLLLLEKIRFAQYPLRVELGDTHVYAGPADAALVDDAWVLKLEREDYLLPLRGMADLQRLFAVNIHSRYFNDVVAKGETIVKKSSNIGKIRAEFEFLDSVPERMRSYFVPVRDYRQGDDWASYTMPKLPMLDASVRFINGNLRGAILERFMADTARYLKAANAMRRPANAETYGFMADKCLVRLKELQALPMYAGLDAFVAEHTEHEGLEAAFGQLMKLLAKEKRSLMAGGEVFSHGDLCLSNMLYDEHAGLLQLIDPRGGKAGESYRSAYYDLAKLSHSVLGGYDHIINGVARIAFDDAMQARLELGIENGEDVRAAFESLASELKLPLRLVRLVEASLFLSMLPLHAESPRKVHMLALRGIEILRDVQAD